MSGTMGMITRKQIIEVELIKIRATMDALDRVPTVGQGRDTEMLMTINRGVAYKQMHALEDELSRLVAEMLAWDDEQRAKHYGHTNAKILEVIG